MKKLYTIAMASAFSLAAAANVNVAHVSSLVKADVDNNLKIRKAVETTLERFKEAPSTKAVDYSTYTWKSVGNGKYAASALAGTYSGSTEPVDVEIYEANEAPGVYKAVGVWPDLVKNGELIVDASDPNFVIVPYQNTGLTDKVDGVTYIASQTWTLNVEKGYSKEIIISALPDLVPTLEDGVINFSEKALVLRWPEAPANSSYGTDASKYYLGADKPGYLVLPGGKFVDPWENLGDATVSGDMYFKIFGETPVDYTCTMKKSNITEGLYRLEDGLKGLYSAFGWSGSPDLDFDISDPDNVTLEFTSSGINGGDEDGMYYVCTMNQNYDNPADCPASARSIYAEEGNKATITIPAKGLLLYASGSDGSYYGNTAPVVISFAKSSGVATIEAAAEEGAVEYYNLQGVRISNPVAGQVVIARQGSKVSKLIVR